MSTKVDASPNPMLMQKLRRLGLLDDDNRLPELDGLIPQPVQRTYLAASGTRSVIRLWADARQQNQRLSATALLIVLDHMRERPLESASILGPLSGVGFDVALVSCALETARSLFESGRSHYGASNIDLSVNFMVEAQREFLFASGSDRLTPAQQTEALGKYGVAVAFSSRWFRTSPRILQRAYEFQKASIASGNVAPQAYEYLVELLAELFNQTRDEHYLAEALRHATDRGLQLAEAELLLKRGVLRSACGEPGAMPDFQRSSELARTFASTTGVEFAEAALVRQFSLAAILSQKPLDAHEVRFPYGFLLDIGGLSPAAADLLRSIVIDALGPMRDELHARGARPNLVAQQVLAAVHGEALERSGFTALDTANDLVAVTAETAAHRSDRHLQWRHSEALLALATTAGTLELIDQAVQFATRLVDAHKSWPLPRVTLARALQLLAAHSGDALVRQRATDAWTNATDLVVNCPEFRRADLGGRSGVFAVEDARGDLSTALVFKPVISRDVGIRESDQLKILREAIAAGSLEDRFGVPRSLGVFPAGPEQHVHVVERQLGRVLSTLEPEEAAEYLAPCVEMLAIYHRAAERPSQNQSGWQSLKRSLKLWARSLFPAPEADDFVNQMKAALPDGLPLVRKRDAHAGNWVIDASNRIIAIDLDGGAFTPVGHDLAQLIEDAAVLPVDRDGFERRNSLFRLYRRGMGLELDSQLLNRAYDWFALYRALWLATSKTASKAQHRHARLLAHHIASTSSLDLLRTPALAAAERMKAASSSRAERDDLTGSQRRLSKAMSRVLRHSAPSLGLMPDDGGFLPLEAVASAVGQPVAAILAVATHPGEPRFQVSDDQIRALYGHSFPVVDLHEINVELPETLYHGTSWDRINQIAERGLSPMSRQHVHLTNNPLEAIEVARRHGRPLLLAVSTAGAGSLRAVADALWASTEVHPSSVQVRNAFAELAAAPSWLTDVGGLEEVGPRTAR